MSGSKSSRAMDTDREAADWLPLQARIANAILTAVPFFDQRSIYSDKKITGFQVRVSF